MLKIQPVTPKVFPFGVFFYFYALNQDLCICSSFIEKRMNGESKALNDMRYFFKSFLFLLFQASCISGVNASHLIGGHIGYEFLSYNNDESKVTFQVTVTAYYDCTSPFWGTGFPEAVLPIRVYEGSYTDSEISFIRTLGLPLADSTRITPNTPENCSFGFNSCIYLVVFQGQVELDVSERGHHFLYDRCCRPPGIQNIHNSGEQAMTYHAWTGPTAGNHSVPNTAPQFFDTLVGYVCANDTTAMFNDVIDPDGDRVEFSIEVPYRGTTGSGNGGAPPPSISPNDFSNYSFPPSTVIWRVGHSPLMPFGTSGYHNIDAQSGLALFSTSQTGPYVIAIELKEYRNNRLIGVTRRDLQLSAIDCPGNSPPSFNSIGTHPKKTGSNTFTIQEGDSLCFPIRYTDADSNDELQLRVRGNLFNTNTTHAPQINTVKNQLVIDEEFCWQTACGEGRSTAYTFVTMATDNGCPPKTRVNDFTIHVKSTPEIEKITGPDRVCPGDDENVEITASPAPDTTFIRWTGLESIDVLNANSDSSTLSLRADTPGYYTFTARNINPFGCESDPVTHEFNVSDSVLLELPLLDSLCNGDTVFVEPLNPQTQYRYEWVYGSDQKTGSSYNAEAVNSRYIYVTATNDVGCSLTDSMYQHVFPLPPLAISRDTTICEGAGTMLRASGSGSIKWTPDYRLSNTDEFQTRARPLRNTKYKAILTDSNFCKNNSSVTINVQKRPDFDAQIDTLLFDGAHFNAAISGELHGAFIKWDNEENNLCTDCKTQNALLTFSQQINLHIYDALGCFSIDTVFYVEIIEDFEVHIPNAFTPNGDGVNDIFIPVYYGIKEIDLFAVFDRWGNKVFETNDMSKGWDGYYKGKLARVNEVYVYKLVARQFNDNRRTYQGKIVVIY